MEICRERTKTSFHCSHCRRKAVSSELIYSFSTNRNFSLGSSSVSLWIRENLRDNSTPIVSLLLCGGLKVFFAHTVFICLKKAFYAFPSALHIHVIFLRHVKVYSLQGAGRVRGARCALRKSLLLQEKKLIKVSRLIQDSSPKFVNEILVSSKPACCNIGGDERTREETKVWHSVPNWFDKVRLCWQPSYFKDGKINNLFLEKCLMNWMRRKFFSPASNLLRY